MKKKARMPWHRHLAGLLGISLAVASPAMPAQTTVPQHWISYAQLTSNQFQEWLSDGSSDLVVRLHAWLEKRDTNDRMMGASVPVVARVWITAEGWVERVEFDSLGDPQADADLRALLSRKSLPEPPPPDMLQPLVLQLKLDPAPADTGSKPVVEKRREDLRKSRTVSLCYILVTGAD